jgi:hypothetical protein
MRDSKLEALIGQALKLWPTKTLYPLLEDPFAIVRQKVVDELQIRGEQVTSPHDSIADFNPPREMDLTLDDDDLYVSSIKVLGYDRALPAFGR